jgi:hypothetical protein
VFSYGWRRFSRRHLPVQEKHFASPSTTYTVTSPMIDQNSTARRVRIAVCAPRRAEIYVPSHGIGQPTNLAIALNASQFPLRVAARSFSRRTT